MLASPLCWHATRWKSSSGGTFSTFLCRWPKQWYGGLKLLPGSWRIERPSTRLPSSLPLLSRQKQRTSRASAGSVVKIFPQTTPASSIDARPVQWLPGLSSGVQFMLISLPQTSEALRRANPWHLPQQQASSYEIRFCLFPSVAPFLASE